MWSYGQNNRTNIEEANKHLQALMDRISGLEQTVKEQHAAIVQKDQDTHMQLMETSRERDKEIKKLQKQYNESQRMLENTQDACKEKDILIARLKQKSNMLSEIVKFRPMIDKFTHNLHNAAKLCLNDSDEEKKKSGKSILPNLNQNERFSNGNLRKYGNHSIKTAHSMMDLSTNNEFENDYFKADRTVNKAIKDHLARSLLTGSTYDLRDADEDYINTAVSYDIDSPIQSSKELYL